MSRTVELGAGTSPDPRANETVDLHADADHQFDLDGIWHLKTDTVDHLIAHHCVEHLADTARFFSEASRVLRPGGTLEITVPVGADAVADHDHSTRWEWRTPTFYCTEQQRHWDPDTDFRLVDRDLTVWFYGPFEPLSGVFDLLADRWPRWAIRRCGSGEITAVYRRTGP